MSAPVDVRGVLLQAETRCGPALAEAVAEVSAAVAPYRDPELVATVERLRAAGVSAETVAAAERYVDADAEFSRLLRMPLHEMAALAQAVSP